MICIAINAVWGVMWADAIDLLWHCWFCKALVARVIFGCVFWIAADAAALGVKFGASSSWMAETPAEGALGGGCG